MLRTYACVALVIWLSAATTGAASPGEAAAVWHRIETDAFAIVIPGEPKTNRGLLPTLMGNCLVASWTVRFKDVELGIATTDCPTDPKARLTPRERLLRARDGTQANTGGAIVRDMGLVLDPGPSKRKWPGRQFELSVPNQDRHYTARMYLVESRLYQIVLVGKDAEHGRVYFERMVKEFRLK